MSHWSHKCQTHNTILKPLQFNLLQASINAISVIEMSLLHHQNVYLNPQYNPTSLCIKEM